MRLRTAALPNPGRLHGLGYVPPFPGSRNLRDTPTGVGIEYYEFWDSLAVEGTQER